MKNIVSMRNAETEISFVKITSIFIRVDHYLFVFVLNPLISNTFYFELKNEEFGWLNYVTLVSLHCA